MSEVAATPTVPANSTHPRRKRLLLLVLALFAVAGLSYCVYWLTIGRYIETTDDAYVAGNVVQITPQVGGTAVEIGVDETQFVRAGELLVQLDRADTRAALQADEAKLAQTVREIRNLFIRTSELQASVAAHEVDLAKVESDLSRREKLADSGAISSEDVQHAREAVRRARAALDGIREQLAGNRALIGGTTVASHPRVQNAAAQLRSSYLDYQRTVIASPVSGFVAKRTIQLGQRVAPGSPLMAVVPLTEVWVDANFKEGQLKHIRPGQPVTVTADANDFRYHGTIQGLAAGTGAAFALLPAQNATGNWIKVVQRLPVRIALDPKELAAHPLRIGLSMEVRVDVHQMPTGNAPPGRDTHPQYRTAVYANLESDVDALINKIIAQNDTATPLVASRMASSGTLVAN